VWCPGLAIPATQWTINSNFVLIDYNGLNESCPSLLTIFEIMNTYQSTTGSSNLKGFTTQVHSGVQTKKKKSQQTTHEVISSSMSAGVVPALGVAVETASSVSGGVGRSAWQAEKWLKLITIMVTGLVRRLRAKHIGFLLKFSAD
jgi:hypothetical protein